MGYSEDVIRRTKQKKRDRKTNNCRQNTTQKNKEWVTRVVSCGVDLCALEWFVLPTPLVVPDELWSQKYKSSYK